MMASISFSQRGIWKELIVSLNRGIIFVNPDDLQIYKDVTIPEDLTKCGLVESAPDDETTPSKGSKDSKTLKEQPVIQHVALSPDGLLLAVTCSGQKALLLYSCRPDHAKLVSVRSLARASSAISFSSSGKILLVTDKTGDCYMFDCENHQEPGKLILGHLSIVYDVLLTPDEKYVITCDRDVKIRVTNFPNCHDIECYCLGHKEFVSSIKLLPTDDKVLVSISGDETIKLWNYEDGTKLCDFKLPAAAIKCTIRKVNEHISHLAVVLYQPNESVFIYEISNNEIREVSHHNFDSIIVTDLCYVGDRLYVAGVKDDHFTLKYVESEKNDMAEKVLAMITEHFQSETVKPEDVSGWFRKNFDNVTEYYERKKRRIEEKTMKER